MRVHPTPGHHRPVLLETQGANRGAGPGGVHERKTPTSAGWSVTRFCLEWRRDWPRPAKGQWVTRRQERLKSAS